MNSEVATVAGKERGKGNDQQNKGVTPCRLRRATRAHVLPELTGVNGNKLGKGEAIVERRRMEERAKTRHKVRGNEGLKSIHETEPWGA